MRQLRERIRAVKLRQEGIRPLLAKFAKATGRNEKDIVGAVASFTTSVVGSTVSGRESRVRLTKGLVGTKDKDTKGRGQQQQQQQQSAGRTVSMARGPGRAKGKVSRRKFHERLVRCGRMGKLGGWKGRHEQRFEQLMIGATEFVLARHAGERRGGKTVSVERYMRKKRKRVGDGAAAVQEIGSKSMDTGGDTAEQPAMKPAEPAEGRATTKATSEHEARVANVVANGLTCMVPSSAKGKSPEVGAVVHGIAVLAMLQVRVGVLNAEVKERRRVRKELEGRVGEWLRVNGKLELSDGSLRLRDSVARKPKIDREEMRRAICEWGFEQGVPKPRQFADLCAKMM
jgi:hypothetical protein